MKCDDQQQWMGEQNRSGKMRKKIGGGDGEGGMNNWKRIKRGGEGGGRENGDEVGFSINKLICGK